MKILTQAMFAAFLVTAVGCGSSTAPTMTLGTYNQQGYNGGTTGTYPGNGIPVPGGTKTMIVLLQGPASTSSNKVFSQTYQVLANDQIYVNAMNVPVMGMGNLGYNQLQLSHLNVMVNGTSLGNAPYGQYTVSTPGTLTLSFDTMGLIGNGWSYSYFQMNFGSGGVAIGRCTSTAGASMPCPPGY